MPGKSAFALCTIDRGGVAVPAIRVDGRIWPLADIAPELKLGSNGLMSLFADWRSSFQALSAVAERLAAAPAPGSISAEEAKFLTPLQYPAKLICAGTNYYDHIAAAGYPEFSKQGNIPALFMKPPTTSLVGPGKTVKYPEGCKQFDWEVELAVVIGTRTGKIAAADAMSCIAGYMVAIDMSARDFQRNSKHFAKMDLFMGKAFDTGCPAGPWFVPAEFAGDAQDLAMSLHRNGAVEQDSRSAHMVWSIAELLEFITAQVTLEPGDVVLTGTPAGTGLEKNSYAETGDVLVAEIENLGRLEVEIY